MHSHLPYPIDFRCKKCESLLLEDSKECPQCGFIYREINGIPVFLDREEIERSYVDQKGDAENAFKNLFKLWPGFYRCMVYLVVPVLFSGLSAKRFIKELPTVPRRILNIGSGPTSLHPNALNVDIFPFPNVHVVANISALPFADGMFDVVVSEQVLEHVSQPAMAARELIRVTKKGGLIYTATPYMFPLHPSPKDYSRWSLDGLRDLFDGCETVRSGVLNGPVSGMLIMMAAGLAMIFSFGVRPLQKVNNYLFMAILSPFKLLDYVYANLPGAEDAAGAVYLIVKK